MSPDSPYAARVDPRIAMPLVAGAGLIALFLYAHPYLGVRHDGFVYALLALRHLYPEALGGDLFFRFGSQDSYTLFPAVYAALINRLGLEPAAWLLARGSGVALVAAAWLLARQLMDRRLAWLAVALFVAIPGKYGAHDWFAYGEDFLTPRPLAEALSLAGVALALAGRRAPSLAVLLAALLVHPLVAAPALACAALLAAPAPAARALLALGIVTVAAAVAIAIAHPLGPLRLLDPQWRSVIEWNAPYLLADQWTVMDWQRAGVPLVTLAIALLAWPASAARRLAGWALLVGAAGLAILLVHSCLAPVVALIQGQGWRWVWLAKAVAVLLLAPLGATLWSRGAAGRALLALIAVAWWGLEDAPLSLPAMLCAFGAALFEFRPELPRRQVWPASALLAGATAAGIIALAGVPPLVPVTGVAVTLWWCVAQSGSATLGAAAATGAVALLALELAATWNHPQPADLDAASRALAPWQARIRPDQAVLFVENPMAPWVLLHRRSYLSAPAAVFSRATALEARARHAAVAAVAGAPGSWFLAGLPLGAPPPTLLTLERLCTLSGLDFIVAHEAFAAPHLPSSAAPPYDALNLYDCRDLREHRAGV